MPAANSNRCAIAFRDGRRCRMLRSPDHPTLCLPHARRELLENALLPPAPPVLVAPGALDNPWAVRRSLKRIFEDLAASRLEPRQASVMVYLARVLLTHTRRARRKSNSGSAARRTTKRLQARGLDAVRARA